MENRGVNKVHIIALTNDEGRLHYDILNNKSVNNFNKSTICKLTIITQGFSIDEEYENIEFVRDDTKHDKGDIFGDIRNYYVTKYADSNYQYLLVLDDDMRFCENFASDLEKAVKYMDETPDIGMLVFHNGPLDSEKYNNIVCLWMDSGMFVRMDAFLKSNKFLPGVPLHDELVFAINIFREGYDIERFTVDILHNRNDYKIGVGSSESKNMIRQSYRATSGKNVLISMGDLERLKTGEVVYSKRLLNEHRYKKLTRKLLGGVKR